MRGKTEGLFLNELIREDFLREVEIVKGKQQIEL